MKTNFFQAIAHLHGQGKWVVTAEFTAEKDLGGQRTAFGRQ